MTLSLTLDTAAHRRDAVCLELAADVLRRDARVRFVAHGTSMLPAIFAGDTLTVENFSGAELRCGELALYRHEGAFRVHRIVEVTEQGSQRSYQTRGDALPQNDPPVCESQILGRVVAIHRRGKLVDLNAANRISARISRWVVRHIPFAVSAFVRWNQFCAKRCESVTERT